MWFLHVCHDSFIRDRCSYIWHDALCLCHDSFICAMTHLCIYMPCLIYTCHDSFMCAVTHTFVMLLFYKIYLDRTEHDASIWVMTHSYVPWLICMYPHSFMYTIMTIHNEGVFLVSHASILQHIQLVLLVWVCVRDGDCFLSVTVWKRKRSKLFKWVWRREILWVRQGVCVCDRVKLERKEIDYFF